MRRVCFALALAALLLAACQRQPEDGKTHLEFWTLSLKPTFTTEVEGMMAQYEHEHPTIALTWLDAPIDAAMPKLMASIAGGVSPDVVNLNSDYAFILASKGALVDMDRAVSEAERAKYFPDIWAGARYNGESYAVPWYVTLQVMMYNADIFQRAGLNPDVAPHTWDDVVTEARTIRQRTGLYGYMPYIKLLDDFQEHNIPILTPDRKHAIFNTPAAVARLQWYVDLFKQDLVPRDTLTRGYQGAIDRYQSGELGMLITGPQFLGRVQDNAPTVYAQTRIAALPENPAGIEAAAVMDFVVPRASHHQREAVDFALFLTNDENQLAFCKKVAILPSRVAAAHDPFFTHRDMKTIEDQAIAYSLAMLPKARDLSLGLPHMQDLSRIVEETLEAALLGRSSATDALNEACRRWDEILASP